MIVLGVDTATTACSVALGDAGGILAEKVTTAAETHSRHVIGMIRDICLSAGIDWSKIEGFAVTSGPGSFTGLRIGVSTVKGLCFALKRPMAAVSTLELLAHQAWGAEHNVPQKILALVNARRKEVYACWFRKDAAGLRACGGVQVAALERVLDAAGPDPGVRVVGDAALLYRERIELVLGKGVVSADPDLHVPKASTLVRLAMPRFLRKETVDAASFAPDYVRKPDIRVADAGWIAKGMPL